MAEKLLSMIMNDGSRHFGDLPQTVLWYELRDHIQRLEGATVTALMRYIQLVSIACVVLFGSCHSQPSTSANEHLDRGNALADRGDLDGAIAEYDRAIAINPNHPLYYFNRGNARKDKREFDLAIADYDKAVSLDANIPEVYNNRGGARMRNGDLDGALSDYNMAINDNPK